MFTGIVEEIGTVRAVRRGAHSSVLSIGAVRIQNGLKIGDSVAVNGVCLTVCSKDSGGFTADVMHETLNRSSLGCLSVGSRVNLERAMAADGRFGGHIVSGHIDGVGCIRALQRDDNALWYTVEAAPQVLRYIVEKGSIAMDGISLTVASVSETDFFGLCYSTYGQRHHIGRETAGRSGQPGDGCNWKICGEVFVRIEGGAYIQGRHLGISGAKRILRRNFHVSI